LTLLSFRNKCAAAAAAAAAAEAALGATTIASSGKVPENRGAAYKTLILKSCRFYSFLFLR
jgi:hypothetical protein